MEHHLAKVGAAGSNPVSRFFYFLKILVLQDLLFLCIKMKKQAPKNLPFMVWEKDNADGYTKIHTNLQ